MAARPSGPRPRPRGFLAIPLIAAAALASPVPVASADDPTTAGELSALLASLDAPQLAERESATAALAERSQELSEALTPELIAGLTPEQRLRVESILRGRFMATNRAGLGVSFRPIVDNGVAAGVRVETVVEGFPAARFLRPGDLIVEVEDEPIAGLPGMLSDTALRYAILSLDPGEALTLTLRRDDETLKVTTPTGSFANLQNAQPPNARLLDGAWRWRAARQGLVDPRTRELPRGDVLLWRDSLRARQDLPVIVPAGRAHAERVAERAVPILAQPTNTQRAITNRRLAMTAQLQHIETRILETQRELAQAQDRAREVRNNQEDVARLRAEIQRFEQLLRTDRQQQKMLFSMLRDLDGPRD